MGVDSRRRVQGHRRRAVTTVDHGTQLFCLHYRLPVVVGPTSRTTSQFHMLPCLHLRARMMSYTIVCPGPSPVEYVF